MSDKSEKYYKKLTGSPLQIISIQDRVRIAIEEAFDAGRQSAFDQCISLLVPIVNVHPKSITKQWLIDMAANISKKIRMENI